MKITLPEHIGEITLGQYQKWLILDKRKDLPELEFNKRKLCIFTDLKYRQLSGVSMKDYDEINKIIDKALLLSPKFNNTFKMDEVEFGFIPYLDNMSTSEFADISLYEKDPQQYHLLMAILFRPIKIKDALNNYSITEYHGTDEYGQKMKGMPLSVVNSNMDFFLSLASELERSTQRSINKIMKNLKKERQQTSFSQNGDGTQILQN